MSALQALSSLFGSPAGAVSSLTAQPQTGAKAQATTSSPTPASSSSSASTAGVITASDFLTLLVTELKNQDPTTSQDPNAYINQLVQINSLQQLIAINQDLTPLATATTPAK